MLRLLSKLLKQKQGLPSDKVTSVTLPVNRLVQLIRARIIRDRAKKVYLYIHRQKVAVNRSDDVLRAYNEWRRLDAEYIKLKRNIKIL